MELTDRYIKERIETDERGCWLWTGALKDGYARGPNYADIYRVTKTLYDGHIWQPGQTADHICRVKRCVNPEHIRVTNRRVNQHHSNDSKRGSMNWKRLRVARDLHDSLPERLNKGVEDSFIQGEGD